MKKIEELLRSGQLLERTDTPLFVLYYPTTTDFEIRGLNDKPCKSVMGIVSHMSKEEQYQKLTSLIEEGKWKIVEFADILIHQKKLHDNPMGFHLGSIFIDTNKIEYTIVSKDDNQFDLVCMDKESPFFNLSHTNHQSLEWSSLLQWIYEHCRKMYLRHLY